MMNDSLELRLDTLRPKVRYLKLGLCETVGSKVIDVALVPPPPPQKKKKKRKTNKISHDSNKIM